MVSLANSHYPVGRAKLFALLDLSCEIVCTSRFSKTCFSWNWDLRIVLDRIFHGEFDFSNEKSRQYQHTIKHSKIRFETNTNKSDFRKMFFHEIEIWGLFWIGFFMENSKKWSQGLKPSKIQKYKHVLFLFHFFLF